MYLFYLSLLFLYVAFSFFFLVLSCLFQYVILRRVTVLEIIKEDGVPTISIGGLEIPLVSGPTMSQYVWALLNLILAIAGVILAIILLIKAFGHKRQNDEEQYENESDEDDTYTKGRVLWIVLSILLGIIGIIVFFITEDMTKLMVLVDRWTIVNAVIFILEVVGYVFSFKKKRNEDDETAIPVTR